jgi:hypothetical protein
LELDNLTTTTKLSVAVVFNSLLDLYEDNEGKQLEFMIILNSMIEDMMDDLEKDDQLNSSERRRL